MDHLPDVIFHEGRKESPCCLFIHGLGMNLSIWTEPERTRILAGRFPITVLLSKEPKEIDLSRQDEPSKDAGLYVEPVITNRITTGLIPRKLKTVFHDLKRQGCTVLAYSQRRPASDCESLVKELDLLLRHYHRFMKNGIIFVAHSRGGLVARKAIELLNPKCLALVTLATPHHGSNLAKLAGSLSGISRVIYPFFENAEKGTARSTIKRIMEFLKSEAIVELLPGSPFISGFDDKRLASVKTLSFGGTDPTLFTVYRWRKDRAKGVMTAEKLFSIPEVLTSFVSEGLLPEELITGKGDGLVSKRSAEAPYAVEHHNLHVNHAMILFAPSVRKAVSSFVGAVS
ncbi:MAG: hypothetical protein GXO94_03480 [Nitrospirae bacterium]|nr:hypothetical protein [Nitrospirota bacterium]